MKSKEEARELKEEKQDESEMQEDSTEEAEIFNSYKVKVPNAENLGMFRLDPSSFSFFFPRGFDKINL